MDKSQELPDIMVMLEEPYLFVGIYAGDDPHTDEPHISWVKAHEQMEPGDRLYIRKRSKVQHDNSGEKDYTFGHWKTKGDN